MSPQDLCKAFMSVLMEATMTKYKTSEMECSIRVGPYERPRTRGQDPGPRRSRKYQQGSP